MGSGALEGGRGGGGQGWTPVGALHSGEAGPRPLCVGLCGWSLRAWAPGKAPEGRGAGMGPKRGAGENPGPKGVCPSLVRPFGVGPDPRDGHQKSVPYGVATGVGSQGGDI